MEAEQLVSGLWRDMHDQAWDKIAGYYSETAVIRVHDTNEQFTLEEFVSMNRSIPGGGWSVDVERLERAGDIVVSVARLTPKDDLDTNFVVSFFEVQDGKIVKQDDYWGVYGSPEEWRAGTPIGKPFR